MTRFFCSLALFAATLTHADERPNILFAISDDQSWPHASAYGTAWVKTPGFDRVAREGLLFHQAYTPNAKCAPSRACILTGRNSWQLEEAANHMPFFPAKFISYAEALDRKAGYFTGSTGKTWAPGIAEDEEGNRRLLAGKPYSARKAKPPAGKISGNDYAGNFEDFLLDATASGKPWAFWYGSTEPHRAYEWRAGIEKGGKSLDEVDRVPEYWPDNETVRTDMLDYAFEIEHFDAHLLRIIEHLDEKGQLDNTLIVVTSDNGMPFPRGKADMYDYGARMPLAIRWLRAAPGGRVIHDFTNLIDLAPTFLEAAGLDPHPDMTGESLLSLLRSDDQGWVDPGRDAAYYGREAHSVYARIGEYRRSYPSRAIRTRDFLYIRNFAPDRWPVGREFKDVDPSPTRTYMLEHKSEIPQLFALAFGKRPEEVDRRFYLYTKARDKD